MKRQDVLTLTRSHQADLESLGVKTLELFGSVARDESSPTSDVDFGVEFSLKPTLFDLFKVQHYLENLIGGSVDLDTRSALKAHLRVPVIWPHRPKELFATEAQGLGLLPV